MALRYHQRSTFIRAILRLVLVSDLLRNVWLHVKECINTQPQQGSAEDLVQCVQGHLETPAFWLRRRLGPLRRAAQ